MAATLKIPVAVLMACKDVRRGQWSFQAWEAESIIAGEKVGAGKPGRTELPARDGIRQVLWTGLSLELHRDGTESYWWNLVSDRPSLFVICHEEAQHGLRPLRVTADHTEAGAIIESDGQVFRVAIPPEVYKQIEAYVVTHHRPREGKKRKRKDWTEDQTGS